MFSYADGYPSLPSTHRRGGPVHVEIILRDLDVTLVERYLTTGEHALEREPGAAQPAASPTYPQAA